MAPVGFQAEGITLLTGMLRTGPGVSKAQAMGTRGHPDFPDPHTRIDALGVERQEADRLWEHQECIRLRIAWLFRQWGATEQPDCPAKEQNTPTPSSSHMTHSS